MNRSVWAAPYHSLTPSSDSDLLLWKQCKEDILNRTYLWMIVRIGCTIVIIVAAVALYLEHRKVQEKRIFEEYLARAHSGAPSERYRAIFVLGGEYSLNDVYGGRAKNAIMTALNDPAIEVQQLAFDFCTADKYFVSEQQRLDALVRLARGSSAEVTSPILDDLFDASIRTLGTKAAVLKPDFERIAKELRKKPDKDERDQGVLLRVEVYLQTVSDRTGHSSTTTDSAD